MSERLHDLVRNAARSTPEALAVVAGPVSLTYRALDTLSDRIAAALQARGVGPGDRVAVWLDKGALAVATFQAILRLGAAYIPVDPWSPVARARALIADAHPAAIVASPDRAEKLEGEARVWAIDEQTLPSAPEVGPHAERSPDDLAYILYTSGSTGSPKGVCLSHGNALSFVRWAADAVGARPSDRFANHAPFHFDLSVLDLYAAFAAGAAVCIVPDTVAADPAALVGFACEQEITIWYSTPSVLTWMMDAGGLLDEAARVSWRVVLFAGEPFPVRHLRRLVAALPGRRFLNLYGPTETNVCTAYEVETLDEARTKPVPIGRATCGDRAWAIREDGARAGPGEQGELWVEGPTVMLGYWGGPPQRGPYATGDLVLVLEEGLFEYVGRGDARLKVRGYRIEPGDIEAILSRHPSVHEVCVVASGEGLEAKLVACVVTAEGPPPTLLELKRLCAEHLPRYMIVDSLRVMPELPRTRNGKIDRAGLMARVRAS